MTDEMPPTTVRVFIALAPPNPAKDELVRELRPVYATHPQVRWNRVEDWHITLAFLGELPVATAALLRPPLAELAATRPAPRLALHGGGTFDERVAWSGIAGDLDGLHGLAAGVRGVVERCGIVLESRPLRPHLTLARVRRGDHTSAGEIAARLTEFRGRTWTAERLHLVGGNPGRGAGQIRYRDIAAWPLGTAAGADTPTPPPGTTVPEDGVTPA
ncbi:RNA 2',3'-cyclic phosphodiesterase [Streptomyces sp. NBC_00525]|uniref:RNA 2',3'-cyclic phosphodiesterase n=1 Tax=Streptomyces sp. NBC_00525 TaxID=2903660 RepID=UPI002E819329|nr:RNA 2',3'-cyclic phosphodiesterase [Streptomyces sp. NBC_00525]WUC92287.1 RNA 2',3'-cyclic phosphodiesterase [Streptomyces sp. NBC_00525]